MSTPVKILGFLSVSFSFFPLLSFEDQRKMIREGDDPVLFLLLLFSSFVLLSPPFNFRDCE